MERHRRIRALFRLPPYPARNEYHNSYGKKCNQPLLAELFRSAAISHQRHEDESENANEQKDAEHVKRQVQSTPFDRCAPALFIGAIPASGESTVRSPDSKCKEQKNY